MEQIEVQELNIYTTLVFFRKYSIPLHYIVLYLHHQFQPNFLFFEKSLFDSFWIRS